MSLQHAAKHLAAHGRGDDKVLVHMTHGELKSLNDLAMAAGGHLTINPYTGLPEAGFLKAMLPMILGAGLAAATGGTSLAMSPAMAGLVVGGGYTAATGSLKQGLMAGLGAYGGAGMGASLASSGANTGANLAGPEALNSATGGVEGEIAKHNAAIAQQNAQNATMAQNKTFVPDYLQDTGPKSGFETSGMPTTSGGVNVASQMKPYTPSEVAEMSENLGNQAGMKISSANPYASPFTTSTQTALSNPTTTGFNTATSSLQGAKDFVLENKRPLAAAGVAALVNTDEKKPPETKTDADQGQRYDFQANPTAAATGAVPNPNIPSYEQMMSNPSNFGAEQRYFNPQYVKRAAGGPVETMSNQAATGANTMYPMANMATSSFATPYQAPISTNMLAPSADTGVGLNGEASMQGARMATGGISDARYNLGGYSDGGRLLRGPGDGVSDDIPAMIGEKQPARLADGEFVVPARIVSELGNGSTEAGARKLYAMMDRVQSARKKTVGKDRVAHNSRADKYLPA
jgi:hypothetical protein